jgi:mono/diheme cytochrome c family protein
VAGVVSNSSGCVQRHGQRVVARAVTMIFAVVFALIGSTASIAQSAAPVATTPAATTSAPLAETKSPETAVPETNADTATPSQPAMQSAATDAPTSPPLAPAVDPAPTTPAPPFPEPPATALAAKAYAVFDTHCARCHQTGKLKIARAARPTANILALDELSADPALVRPGVPDASPLYTILLRRHSPLLGPEIWPPIGEDMTAADVQAVRDWIQDLPAFKPGACPGRPPITPAASTATVEAFIAALPPEKAKNTRFVSLANLYNTCATYPELNGYREAVTRVINSLSWKPEPVRLETIDPERTILKFDLSDAGWVDAHWEKLVQAYPHAGGPTLRTSDSANRKTGSTVPVVRGDWFAATAMTPPLYHSLLGLPARFANLQRILNTDRDANIKAGLSRRAAIAESTITRAGRIAERHPTKEGSLWISYDFAGSEGRQNVTTHPLGPAAPPGNRAAFKHDLARALFTMPNGFIGFALNDPAGDRLDRSPAQIDRDLVGWAAGSGNGLACAGCHIKGPLNVRDEVRATVETPEKPGDKPVPKDLREAVLALYPTEADFQSLVDDDHQRHRKAMRNAGLNPDLTVHGMEPMTALARQYQKDASIGAMSAETGLSVDDLLQRFADAPEAMKPAVRRLKQGSISRPDFNRLAAFATREPNSATAPPTVESTSPARGLDLRMWPTQDRYKAGELAAFFVESNMDCNLTLISVDAGGRGTVLFPNEFEQNNLLPAGKALRVPSESAPFQLRLKTPGRETVVGICNVLAKTVDGIVHDYERQRFTILGDWRTFLGQLSLEEGADQKADRTTEARTRARQPQRTRARPNTPAAPGPTAGTTDAAAAPAAAIEMQARTAVTVEVD